VIRNCELCARRGYLHRYQRRKLSQDSAIITFGVMAMNPQYSADRKLLQVIYRISREIILCKKLIQFYF